MTETLLDLWLSALSEPLGLSISTSDRKLLRQQLYEVRARAKNPDLERISIIFPEKEGELWLVKRDADGGGASDKNNP